MLIDFYRLRSVQSNQHTFTCFRWKERLVQVTKRLRLRQAKSTNSSKYKTDSCPFLPDSDCLSVVVPSRIEDPPTTTYPNDAIVFDFGKGTLPHKPLNLPVRHATTFSSHEFDLDRKCFF